MNKQAGWSQRRKQRRLSPPSSLLLVLPLLPLLLLFASLPVMAAAAGVAGAPAGLKMLEAAAVEEIGEQLAVISTGTRHGGGGGGGEAEEIPDLLSRDVRDGIPGQFNLYIFAMSWKAEWCYHQSYPGCRKPRAFWENNLTIHGLWPDYGDGTYPTVCTSEPYDHDRVVDAVGLDVLETLWPNIQVPEELEAGKKSKTYDSFWEHEWTKHGTCTGLSMEDYFATAVALLQLRFVTPPQLAQNVGGHITRVELEDAYGGDGMAVLDCKGKVHLNQVYLCLEQDPVSHLPGQQVACPPAIVRHDDTCGQDSLDIAAFE